MVRKKTILLLIIPAVLPLTAAQFKLRRFEPLAGIRVAVRVPAVWDNALKTVHDKQERSFQCYVERPQFVCDFKLFWLPQQIDMNPNGLIIALAYNALKKTSTAAVGEPRLRLYVSGTNRGWQFTVEDGSWDATAAATNDYRYLTRIYRVAAGVFFRGTIACNRTNSRAYRRARALLDSVVIQQTNFQ